METKDTPDIVMREKVKEEFRQWYIKARYTYEIGLNSFYELPFDFQSGIYTAYLRDKGIDAYAWPQYGEYKAIIKRLGIIKFKVSYDDHNAALISAINEGFRIVEEQLRDK